jgi:guanylate kinase
MNLIRSFTTRELRAGQDEEYRHVDREEFLQLIENGEFLWNTDPEISHGNLYGTLRCDIEEALSHRCPSLIHVTPHTIHHLREYERARARVFSVYVNVEDEDLLRKRLEARDPDEVPAYYEERIVKCRGWKEFAGTSGRFNMCIENDGRYHLREIMEELLHNLTRPIGFPVSF